MTPFFKITNTFSGLVLGIFEAKDEDGALDAWELQIEPVDGEEK